MAETKAKNAHVWARDGLDWYVEGVDCTEALLRVERFPSVIYDPCCGGGNIVEAAGKAEYGAIGSDVVDRRAEGVRWFHWFRADFLTEDVSVDRQCGLVMNPPFFKGKGTEAFIRRAIELGFPKIACFHSLPFLGGVGRATGLFDQHPPTRTYILCPRPSCPPGEALAAGQKAAGGTEDWCWSVWDQTAPRVAPTFHWLVRGRQ